MVVTQVPFCQDAVEDVLIGQGRVVTRVERGLRTAGAMALGAVGIDVGTRPIFERRAGVRHRRQPRVIRDVELACDGRIKQAELVQRAKLIIRAAGVGVQVIPVQLAGLDAEDVVGGGRVAGETILRTRIVPGLGARPAGGLDDDVLAQTVGKQVSVAVVGPPFVSEPVNRAVGAAHEQPRFQPAPHGLIQVVGREFKVFHENGSGGEGPFAVGRKSDLFALDERRAVIRHGEPPRLVRAVGPQRRVDRVSDQTVGARERRHVRERPGLREQQRQRAVEAFWHLQECRAYRPIGQAVSDAGCGVDRDVHRRGCGHDSAVVRGDGGQAVIARPDFGPGECIGAVGQRHEFGAQIEFHFADGTIRIIGVGAD